MGDLLQIEPVFGSWIYEQPKELVHEIHLWRLFKVNQLVQNVRQSGIYKIILYIINKLTKYLNIL